MPLLRRCHRALSTLLVAGLAASLGAVPAVAGVPDAPRLGADAGTSGVGDPYFPLDGNGGMDVLHYKIRQAWNFERQELRGTTTLTLTTTADLSSFNLDFLLPVGKVRVNGTRARFTQKRHELVVRPARPLAAGTRAKVQVRYRGRPGKASYLGERNLVQSDGEVTAVNQPHMAPWWFPSNDHPSDRATFDVATTVPAGRQVIGNGRLVRRSTRAGRTTWRWRSAEPMATYLAFFVAGRFKVTRTTDRAGRPTWYAVSRRLSGRDQRRATKMLRTTPAVTAWLEQKLQRPYPWSSNGGVVVPDLGFALENATRPVYSWWGKGMGTVNVHELAHQWFGDDVSLQRWSDIWLNEGAASFMEWWWEESHGGTGGPNSLKALYETPAATSLWNTTLADPGAQDIFAAAVYAKGAMVFQALRNRLGEATFAAVLTAWLTERAGRTGTTAQFEELASRVSGQDLSGFFTAWLHQPGKPARTAANGLA